MDTRESLVNQASVGNQVLAVSPVTLELKDYRVIAAYPDNLVTRVSLVKVATLDKKVFRDILESLDYPVTLESKVLRDTQELKELLVTLEPMVYQAIAELVVLAANLVIAESQDSPEFRDIQDPRHTQALAEIQGIRVSQDSRVIPVIPVTMEILGTRVLADIQGSKASLVIVDNLERVDIQVYLDLVATVESKA